MAFKPYCPDCKTWHTEHEGHQATSEYARIRRLIEVAEATVMMSDPNPNEKGKVIVGFRVDRSNAGIASLVAAFNEMVDLAKSAALSRS